MSTTAEKKQQKKPVVTIGPGDFNLNIEQVRDRIARPAGAKYVSARAAAEGTGVDGMLVRGAKVVCSENLGRLGSDNHDAIHHELQLPGGASLEVVQWNVWVGNTPDNVRDQLARFNRRRGARPAIDVVAMQEVNLRSAKALVAFAAAHDWWFQATPYGGNDREGCVLMVRKAKGRRLLGRDVMTMRQAWTGPKHGIRHKPREFPRGRFELESGVRLRATSLHGPTGGPDGPNAAAVREFCQRTSAWLGRA